MIYKLHESVFLKKEADKVYLYSLNNETLVVQATGLVSLLMEKLKVGCDLPEIEKLLGSSELRFFQEMYARLSSAEFTISENTGKNIVKDETFSSPAGSLQFTSFEDLFGSSNVAVYASYCATNCCSYCDNCTCSDC